MQKSTVIKIAIPIIAALVIIESVIVLTNLSNRNQTQSVVDTTEVSNGAKKAVVTQVLEPAQADMVFEVGSKAMKQGQSYPVSLNLTTRRIIRSIVLMFM